MLILLFLKKVFIYLVAWGLIAACGIFHGGVQTLWLCCFGLVALWHVKS